jgi:hypothetical protein
MLFQRVSAAGTGGEGMDSTASLQGIYRPSDEVVDRDIEGEIILVPLTGGVGELEDELFTLNETGKSIWRMLDGKRCLREVVEHLRLEYDGDEPEMVRDVLGLVQELLNRRMVVEVSGRSSKE